MHKASGWLLTGAVMLSGCGSAPDANQVRQEVRSWTASVRLAAGAWLRRDVSGRYLEQVTREAGRSLGDLAGGPLGAQVTQARSAVQAADQAARRDDRAAMQAVLRRLR